MQYELVNPGTFLGIQDCGHSCLEFFEYVTINKIKIKKWFALLQIPMNICYCFWVNILLKFVRLYYLTVDVHVWV